MLNSGGWVGKERQPKVEQGTEEVVSVVNLILGFHDGC